MSENFTTRQILNFIQTHPNAMRGDAYCYHPESVIVGNLVFVDGHHVHGDATVYAADHCADGWNYPRNSRDASISGDKFDAIPRPKNGTLTQIWWNGTWYLGVTSEHKEAIRKALEAQP